jgi:prophage antirepressor-like protein
MTHRNPTAMDSRFPPTSASPNATLSLFHFNDNAIRTDVDRKGNPWFVAADVCAALDIKNSRQALSRLDDDEKGVISSDTNRGLRSIATVNEAGLYDLIFRSRKHEAKEFKRWVKQTVLPALRKDGMYVQGEENLFAECVTESDQVNVTKVAQPQVADLFNAKVLRLRTEHQEEKDARHAALGMINRGRVRRHTGPKRVQHRPSPGSP